jgi:phage-related protein
MVETNSAFKEESRKQSTQPIFLYTIYDYNGTGVDLPFAAYDINVIFDGIEYQKFPITHDEITENTKGEIDNTKVRLSNIARLIEYYLQNYDLRGKKVSIKMVWANKLDDPDCYIEFSNYIDSYSSNVKDVVFSLMSKFDVLNVTIPGMIWLRDFCQWLFPNASSWVTDTLYAVGALVKINNISYECLIAHTSGTFATDLAAGKWTMTECGYGGSETSCNRTWQRCKELNNSRRFIGCRAIPGRRGHV